MLLNEEVGQATFGAGFGDYGIFGETVEYGSMLPEGLLVELGENVARGAEGSLYRCWWTDKIHVVVLSNNMAYGRDKTATFC